MASRYDTLGGGNQNFWQTQTQTQGPSTVDTETTQNTQNTTNSSSSTQYSKDIQTSTQNMDPSSLAALELLIAQLTGGGTQAMAEDRAKRLQEILAVQAMRDQYSKAAAFTDAQGAMNQFLRQAMEKAMPTLVRSAEGAGTSQNSMRGLLTNDILSRASEGAATIGLNAASNYGTIGANLSSLLERLTQPNDTATQALLNALNIAKGATQETQTSESGTSNTSGTQTSTGTNTTNQQVNNSGSTNQTTTQRGNNPVDFFSAPMAGASGGLSSFSNQTDPTQLSTTAWNMLAQLNGGNLGWANTSNWNNYTDF